MESETKKAGLGKALLALASTALLIYRGNGLHPWWPLMWLAALPVLLLALKSTAWSAALVAWLAFLVGGLNLFGYMHLLGLPVMAWFSSVGLGALVFAVAVLLFRALVRRGALWSALLSLPAAFVTFEYLRNLLWIHGTAASLAYSQLNCLPILQLASITGPWGITAVLLFFSAGLAIAWSHRHTMPRQAGRILAVTLGTPALVLLLGGMRLGIRQPGPSVQVGLVAASHKVTRPGPETQQLFRSYAAQVRQLAERGAKVVVLPEKIGVVLASEAESTDAILQQVADRSGITIVAGVVSVAQPLQYNQARIYAPGIPVQRYDKHHMLPPWELVFTPGTTRTVLHRDGGTWGVEICKDMDFTPLARHYGQAGVGLMLVPGWDFRIDDFWHGHIAVMRGVEDGFSVVHAAKDGFLTVTDNRGRVLAQTRAESPDFATLLASVPEGHSATPYLLLGDWFAWLAMALLAGVLARLGMRLARRAEAPVFA